MSRRSRSNIRLRDIPFIPLLVLLHIGFIASSLLLRLFQSFHSPTTIRPRISRPPKHLAVVLTSRKHDLGGRTSLRKKFDVPRALLSSIKRLTEWAAEVGVEELSIWDRHGLVEKYRQEILSNLMDLPPSPPSSGTSSPSPFRPSGPPSTLDAPDQSSTSTSITTTYTIYPTPHTSLQLHLIPLSSLDLIASLTKRYVSDSISKDDITQNLIDRDIKNLLGFDSDPSLLIVHPLEPPSFLRALLPRSPPELDGYPFWTLRITEIYQHPTPLPIPSLLIRSFSPILYQAQMSSLPLIRKAARLLPLTEMDSSTEYISGAIGKGTWQGAMSAWTKVEQRLGK